MVRHVCDDVARDTGRSENMRTTMLRYFTWIGCALLVASLVQWGCHPEGDGDADADVDADSDADGDADGDGDADCGLAFSTDAVCQGCMEQICCDEMEACSAGTDCGAMLTCFEGCAEGDEACSNQCMSDHETGVTDAQALFTCATDSCGADCGLVTICGSELGYSDAALNECLTENCCATFTPCIEDDACLDCLTNSAATGCDTNALYTAFTACEEASCTSICGTGIGNWTDSEPPHPVVACNQCDAEHCCTPLQTCVGDSSDTAVELCIACLNDPAGADCTNAAIGTAATEFNTCQETNCAAECGE